MRLYFIFFGLFASLMLASLETGNLGLLFVLVEASTLASAALVGLEGKARSLEAAWKYVIISSLGVTIALAGTLFLFYAGSALHLASNQRLTWPYLFAHAAALAPQPLRLAFLLAVVGYGTKVGLAPMHTWLPDAHAEAPSPASAMLSAALLNTGMYAIIRFLAITQARLGDRLPPGVLLVFGFAVHRDRGAVHGPARELQAAVRVLLGRAHGHHRGRARVRRGARALRCAAAHPQPRDRQGGAVPGQRRRGAAVPDPGGGGRPRAC